MSRGPRPILLCGLLLAAGCADAIRLEGSFTMGCDAGFDEACAVDGERVWAGWSSPAFEVQLSPYRLDRFEVRRSDYHACVEAGDCGGPTAGAELAGCPWVYEGERLLAPDDGDFPATCMTASAAQAYCRVQGGDLPSEAQWEFAARGPEGRAYPWGGDGGPLCDRAGVWTCPGAALEPVDARPDGASPDGIEGLIGNAAEWTLDAHSAAYPEFDAIQVDPVGLWEPTDPEQPWRAVRGGAAVPDGRHWLPGEDEGPGAWLAIQRRVLWRASSPAVGFRCAY